MSSSIFLLAACLVLPGGPIRSDGIIEGVVVNASDNNAPVADAEVVLRIKLEGRFTPLADTTTDRQGRFRFRNLLVGSHFDYLPGANRHGIHYPGPRLRLTTQQRQVRVKLPIHDSVTHPSPLVIRSHDILIRPEPGALKITESILVANPSAETYVGRPAHEGVLPGDGDPVTLRLGIPADFDRVTFEKEFFGRRFALVDGKLVTGIPWTPGEREIKFTYVLRNARKQRLWTRPLDLPCSQVRIRVYTDKPDEVVCNLEAGPNASDNSAGDSVEKNGEVTQLTFQSQGDLPAGHVIRLELGHLPVPWMVHGRWLALAALGLSIGAVIFMMIRRSRRAKRQSTRSAPPPQPGLPTAGRSEKEARKNRRRGKQSGSLRRAA